MRIPALLFHARHDRETSLQESEMITLSWQGSQLIVTEGLGHNRILRDEQVIQQAVKFIKEA